MFKILSRLVRISGLIIGAAVLSVAQLAWAGGPGSSPIDVSTSTSNQVANGSSVITVNLSVWAYKCNSDGTLHDSPDSCGTGWTKATDGGEHMVFIYASGSGNKFGGTQTGDNGVPYVMTDTSGAASFTLSSTTVETKTLKFTQSGWQAPGSDAPVITVTFTAVPAAPAPTTSARPTSTVPTVPVEVQPPETPKTTSLAIGNQPVVDARHITLNDKQPLVLQGATVPNGIIKLYIFSTPREVTVTADAQGKWSYSVTGLEPGQHHVEAEVTDPATSKTSARATLASFAVRAPKKATVSRSNAVMWLILGLGGILFAVGAVGVWWFLRHRQRRHDTQAVVSTDTTTAQPNKNNFKF